MQRAHLGNVNFENNITYIKEIPWNERWHYFVPNCPVLVQVVVVLRKDYIAKARHRSRTRLDGPLVDPAGRVQQLALCLARKASDVV
jgi:hypothetical protein